MGDLPMRLVLTPLPSGTDNNKRDVAVMLWMDGIPGTASQSFDVELRAFTMEGGAKLTERRTGQTSESKTGNSTFELLARIALPPGRYEIRAAARLAPANLAGSVFGDLPVAVNGEEPRLALGGCPRHVGGREKRHGDAVARKEMPVRLAGLAHHDHVVAVGQEVSAEQRPHAVFRMRERQRSIR